MAKRISLSIKDNKVLNGLEDETISISSGLKWCLKVARLTNDEENLIDLLFIIPYSIPGFIFAYVYTKSKNIFIPIFNNI